MFDFKWFVLLLLIFDGVLKKILRGGMNNFWEVFRLYDSGGKKQSKNPSFCLNEWLLL